MTITNAEIVGRFKPLAEQGSLKANSGSTTTAVNTNLIAEADQTNNYVCFLSGSNLGVDRVISSFDDATGTLTFDALTTAVDNTTEFCIIKTGYQSDVAQAELFITNHFRNKGLNIDLFLTSSQLKELYIYKTLELICRNLMNDGTDTDMYFVAMNRFEELYNIEMASLIADYDANEDGVISEDEEESKVGQVIFSR